MPGMRTDKYTGNDFFIHLAIGLTVSIMLGVGATYFLNNWLMKCRAKENDLLQRSQLQLLVDESINSVNSGDPRLSLDEVSQMFERAGKTVYTEPYIITYGDTIQPRVEFRMTDGDICKTDLVRIIGGYGR